MDSRGQARWTPRAVTLPAGMVHSLVVPAQVRINRGTLWLTIDGEPDDIVLEPGDGRVLGGGRRVLACALGGEAVYEWLPVAAAAARDARGRLPAPGAEPWRSRLARRLRRAWRAWRMQGAGA